MSWRYPILVRFSGWAGTLSWYLICPVASSCAEDRLRTKIESLRSSLTLLERLLIKTGVFGASPSTTAKSSWVLRIASEDLSSAMLELGVEGFDTWSGRLLPVSNGLEPSTLSSTLNSEQGWSVSRAWTFSDSKFSRLLVANYWLDSSWRLSVAGALSMVVGL